MTVAFETGGQRRRRNGREEKLARENEALKARLATKDNVIAEVTEEFVRPKKHLGSPDGSTDAGHADRGIALECSEDVPVDEACKSVTIVSL